MENIIHDDRRPGSTRPGPETLLTNSVHVPRDDLRSVLQKVRGEQNRDDYWIRALGGEADAGGPDQAVDRTVKCALLLVQRHPVVLEKVVSYEMTDDCV